MRIKQLCRIWMTAAAAVSSESQSLQWDLTPAKALERFSMTAPRCLAAFGG
jgi:hypothetical protein